MVDRKIVAVLEWRAAALLRENRRFLEKAAQAGRVQPRDERPGTTRHRSLILRADGSCEMQRFTVRTVARRLRGMNELKMTRKARNSERG